MNALPKAFQHFIVSIPLGRIIPQTSISAEVRTGAAFRQIAASVKEIGLIEPLVVFQQSKTEYLLLDGHLRLDVLKEAGAKEARCILATDDESYTYNRRVNTIPPIGKDALTLTVCQRYVERLLKNAKVVRYLERRHDRSLGALQLWLEKRQLSA
jgi:hypothetical protein